MEKFELHILGCGSALPTTRHFATSQVVNLRDKLFMIDCGEGAQMQLRKSRLKFSRLNHIFISHLHGDHFFGLIGFLSTLSLQGRRGEMHIYAEPRLQELIGCQMKILHSRFTFPLFFHALSRREEVIYEDKVVTVTAFPLKHHYDTPVSGFLFREKERERTILKDRTAAWNVPIAFMQYLKRGEDFITPEGEIVANELLTVAPPPARS